MFFAQPTPPQYRGDLAHHRHWLGLLVMLLIVAGVTVLVSWLVARFMARRPPPQMAPAGPGLGMRAPMPPPAEDNALATLRLRYANGDIGRDDYLQAVADLTGSPPAPGP